MVLDLRNTFWFSPRAPKGTRDWERASYTIKTLGLNARDWLPPARKQAFNDYVNCVRRYQYDRDRAASPLHLETLRSGIRCRQHPTVWREMVNQRDWHPELRPLFAEVPEAADW